jgi:hypothetical protein
MTANGSQVAVTCGSDFTCGLIYPSTLHSVDKFQGQSQIKIGGDSNQGPRLIIEQELLLVRPSSWKVWRQLSYQQEIFRPDRAFSTQVKGPISD